MKVRILLYLSLLLFVVASVANAYYMEKVIPLCQKISFASGYPSYIDDPDSVVRLFYKLKLRIRKNENSILCNYILQIFSVLSVLSEIFSNATH